MPPRRPKMHPRRPKIASRWPKTAQEAPKRPPRQPKRPPRAPPGARFFSFTPLARGRAHRGREGKAGACAQLRQARSRGNLRSWLPTQHHLAQLHARIRCDSRGKKQPTLHPKTTKDDLVSAIHAVSMSKLSAPTVPGVNAQRTRQDPNISSMILSTTCECHVLSVSG